MAVECFSRGKNFDDVEAERHILPVEQSQPCQRTSCNETPFLRIHRAARSSEVGPRSSFDLYKDQRGAPLVPANEIHFAAFGTSEIPVQDLVAALPQKFGCSPFSRAAQPMPRISWPIPAAAGSAEPAERFCDGSRKALEPGAAPCGAACCSLCGGRTHIRDTVNPFQP